jgi:hypothetical protein
VILANNANLSQATITETQLPTAWSGNSVSVSVNLGKFSNGQTAYVFVFDSSGAANSTGFPVSVGGTAVPAKEPKPPTDVSAQ